MLNHRSLSRRTALKASGAGALALSLPLGLWTQAASAADAGAGAGEAPQALQRGAWAALVGRAVSIVDGPQLRVDAVRDLNRALAGRDDAFAVVLSAPAGHAPQPGVQLFELDGGDPIGLFVAPVGPAGARVELELIVDRTVPLPRGASVEMVTAPVASPVAERASAAASPSTGASTAPTASVTKGRQRVRATGRRTSAGIALELEFPGGGVQAVKLRLLRDGTRVASGGTVVRRGAARTVLRVRHGAHVKRGSYRLELQLTDLRGGSTTIERAVTVR
ncbi:MAG: hypothetical protein PGN13_02820 [Patulibacter minatonensis]